MSVDYRVDGRFMFLVQAGQQVGEFDMVTQDFAARCAALLNMSENISTTTLAVLAEYNALGQLAAGYEREAKKAIAMLADEQSAEAALDKHYRKGE